MSLVLSQLSTPPSSTSPISPAVRQRSFCGQMPTSRASPEPSLLFSLPLLAAIPSESSPTVLSERGRFASEPKPIAGAPRSSPRVPYPPARQLTAGLPVALLLVLSATALPHPLHFPLVLPL